MIAASPTTPDWLCDAARVWADLLGVEHWTISLINVDETHIQDYVLVDPVTLHACINLSPSYAGRGITIACLVQGLLRIALASVDHVVLATIERVPKREYHTTSQVYQGSRDLALAQLAVALVSSLQTTVDLRATLESASAPV